jgi:nitrite reductase/ring-hydroxylating ferredoxin subunit
MAIEKKYNWYKLAEPAALVVAEHDIILLEVGNKQFCLTQTNGTYFAFQPNCPHAGASFEHGWLNEKGNLICPLHRFEFDVCTGRNPSGEGFHLITYPIDVNEHGIWIGISQQIW